MIIRTDAVVLRSLDYGETSEIVTLFTRDRGKLAVMAKGSRRSGSRFGSSLQPMSYTQVVFYYKPSRTVQTLSESSHVRSFHGITRNLDALSHGLRIVELISALMQDEEQNIQAFNLLVDSLDRLHRSPAHTENVLFYFQLHFASVLGFAPDIDRESLDDLSERGGLLSLDTGSIVPFDTADGRTLRRATRTALRAFAICAKADLETITRMRVDDSARIELRRLIEDYFRHHVQEAYPTRSAKVVGEMLEGRSKE